MKTLILTIILYFCFSLSTESQTSVNWENIGPGAGSDLHVLTFQPDNADVIYIGGDIEGIFKTTDGGQSWKNINNNLAQLSYGAGMYWINDIIFHPIDYQTIYLCCGVGLFKSTNGGQQWNELYTGIIENEAAMVSTIAITPENPDIIYMGLGDRAVGSKADFKPFEPFDGKTGLFKSVDGGTSWELLNVGMPMGTSISSIAIADNNTDVVLISTTNGVFKSIDGGNSWQEKNAGLPHTNCYIMKGIVNASNYNLYLTVKTLATSGDESSFSGGFFKSTDLGESWIDITSNLPRYDNEEGDDLFNDFWKFDINPHNPNSIFVATTTGSSFIAGIFKTTNGNSAQPDWELIYTPEPGAWLDDEWLFDPYSYEVRIASSDTSVLATITVGVVISRDGGSNWKQHFAKKVGDAWQTTGMELMNTDGIGFHQSNPEIIYVGYDDMGLFRSEDGGQSFLRLDTHQDPEIGNLFNVDAVKDIEVDPVNGDLYMSRFPGSLAGHLDFFDAGGIVFSSDLGNTVSSISEGLPYGRCDLAMSKTIGVPGQRTLYTAVFNYGAYKSTNSGKNWTEINTGLGENAKYAWEIVIDPSNEQVLYFAVLNMSSGIKSLYKSIDTGQNWKLLENFPEGDILCIFVDNLGNVFVGLTNDFDWSTSGGIYKSSDGGTNWTKIFEHQRITDIQVHPELEDVIIASGSQWYMLGVEPQGIYLSIDGGINWENITTTMNHTFFNFARFHPLKPNYIYTGTAGGGLWVSDSLDLKLTDVKDFYESSWVEVYPNPFIDYITIKLEFAECGVVEVELLNNLGVRVAGIEAKYLDSGIHNLKLNVEDIPSGIYYCAIKSVSGISINKMVHIK